MKIQTKLFAAFMGLATISISTLALSCQDRDSLPATLKVENSASTLLKPQDLSTEDHKKDTTKLPPKKDRHHWLEGEG